MGEGQGDNSNTWEEKKERIMICQGLSNDAARSKEV